MKQISTKESLYELLNENEKKLSKSNLDYLKSLVELDFSVVRDYMNGNDKKRIIRFRNI